MLSRNSARQSHQHRHQPLPHHHGSQIPRRSSQRRDESPSPLAAARRCTIPPQKSPNTPAPVRSPRTPTPATTETSLSATDAETMSCIVRNCGTGNSGSSFRNSARTAPAIAVGFNSRSDHQRHCAPSSIPIRQINHLAVELFATRYRARRSTDSDHFQNRRVVLAEVNLLCPADYLPAHRSSVRCSSPTIATPRYPSDS